MSTKYETGVWYGWNGGECPVHPKALVEIVARHGEQESRNAAAWDWDCQYSPIRAFRVVEPYVPPLEVWIPVYAGGHLGGNYYSEEQAAQVASGHPVARVALFREVREAGDT